MPNPFRLALNAPYLVLWQQSSQSQEFIWKGQGSYTALDPRTTASSTRHRGKSWPVRRRAKFLSETLKVI